MEKTERQRQVMQELRQELHDMCQPLTVLQCRLDIGKKMGDRSSLAEAVELSGGEVARLFASVARMQALLLTGSGV